MEASAYLQPLVNTIIPRALKNGLAVLSPVEKNIFLVWCYPAAINDGGHASFFYNSYGDFAKETVQALRDIGARDYADILERAIDQFPMQEVPRDIVKRNEVFNSLSEVNHQAMEDCDSKFYDLGGDELLSRLFRYGGGCAA